MKEESDSSSMPSKQQIGSETAKEVHSKTIESFADPIVKPVNNNHINKPVNEPAIITNEQSLDTNLLTAQPKPQLTQQPILNPPVNLDTTSTSPAVQNPQQNYNYYQNYNYNQQQQQKPQYYHTNQTLPNPVVSKLSQSGSMYPYSYPSNPSQQQSPEKSYSPAPYPTSPYAAAPASPHHQQQPAVQQPYYNYQQPANGYQQYPPNYYQNYPNNMGYQGI